MTTSRSAPEPIATGKRSSAIFWPSHGPDRCVRVRRSMAASEAVGPRRARADLTLDGAVDELLPVRGPEPQEDLNGGVFEEVVAEHRRWVTRRVVAPVGSEHERR